MTLPSKKSLTELFKTYERQRDHKVVNHIALKTYQIWFEHLLDLKEIEFDSKDLASLVHEMMERTDSHQKVDSVLDNNLLEGHGIEAIRGEYHVNNYYHDIVALYVNMGDTYNLTLLYDTDRGKFYVTTMGDWVEKNDKRYAII